MKTMHALCRLLHLLSGSSTAVRNMHNSPTSLQKPSLSYQLPLNIQIKQEFLYCILFLTQKTHFKVLRMKIFDLT